MVFEIFQSLELQLTGAFLCPVMGNKPFTFGLMLFLGMDDSDANLLLMKNPLII